MTTKRTYGLMPALVLAAALLAVVATHAVAEEPGQAKATFAGGCFWCVEEAFEKVPGVLSAVSGYTDGHVDNPSYKQVTSGRTGHTEAVEVIFDPAQVTYEQLLDVFWRNVDPTVVDRQFCDVGNQYRTGIFVHDDEQKRLAEASRKALEESKPFAGPIVTPIAVASTFYPAEDYHQDYYKHNPLRYKFYKWNCGRAQRLEELWG
ncbi:MAG: peptide-methionine (S)-S-oxide reductase MsrA [Candidatus Tectomicrobia bacterium]|nr:peptide-methionine (S)-S-oxide reductase MsrA [Candidatus Tectomicrobia bacterium]